jgi:hypothetical protein
LRHYASAHIRCASWSESVECPVQQRGSRALALEIRWGCTQPAQGLEPDCQRGGCFQPRGSVLRPSRGIPDAGTSRSMSAPLRHYCRFERCRSRLAAPVENTHRAFCTRSCHSSFYRHRCLVCEKDLPKGPANRKICKSAKCRSEYRRFSHVYHFCRKRTATPRNINKIRP